MRLLKKLRLKKKVLIICIILISLLYFMDIIKNVCSDTCLNDQYSERNHFQHAIKTLFINYELFQAQNTIDINSNCPVCKTSIQINARKFKDISKTKYYCNLYSMITRNSSQNVISLSLYGSNETYYNGAKEYIKQARKYYPDWLIRIYSHNLSNPNIICEIECSDYGKNVDFCDVSQIPYFKTNSNGEPDMYYVDLSYMHAMSWRFLPIGDDFVDVFMSRDTDAWIIEREMDSFNIWLQSNDLFHIMRDHPYHDVPILGGLWGFKNRNNRQLSKKLFNIFTNHTIANHYNPNGTNKKGEDQFLLRDYIWPIAKLNATIHDSYFCKIYEGKPFPNKRTVQSCFISCTECCNEEFSDKIDIYTIRKECPLECRPEFHKDWSYC